LKIINAIEEFEIKKRVVITIGTFDGVHIGHKKIIEKLVTSAKELDSESLILTFFPHPRMILETNFDMKLLNTIDERKTLLSKLNLDHLIIHPFDQKFSELSAEKFVENILVNQFNIKKIIIGHDHRFGKNRTATIVDLIRFGKKYNFEVEQISVQEINNISISSTKIRKALTEGNIRLANKYLGYDYIIRGIVVKGKQLGRSLHFPTANIKVLENYKLIPKNGVYIIKSSIYGINKFGMMNIGIKPTIGSYEQTIEVHFFDLHLNLYDQILDISILEKMREEQKFNSISLLKEQLKKDKQIALQYIQNNFDIKK